MANGKKDDDIAFSISNPYNDSYNESNGNNGGYTVIKPEDIKQLNNPACTHSNMRRDDSDTIGDTVAWVCPDCGRGVFLPKSVTKIT